MTNQVAAMSAKSGTYDTVFIDSANGRMLFSVHATARQNIAAVVQSADSFCIAWTCASLNQTMQDNGHYQLGSGAH